MMENEIFEQLAAPFGDGDIEWRVQRCGKKKDRIWASLVPYVDSRAIMRRLDNVVGPAGWSTNYEVVHFTKEEGVRCTILIKVDDEWVGKTDAAPVTDIEPIKGAFSGALKRAAVHWGMGRHLYASGDFWAENITTTRPPKGKRAVHISFKDGNDRVSAWCDVPSLNGKPEPPKPKPNPDRQASDKQINYIKKMLKSGKVHPDVKDRVEKWLAGEKQCSVDASTWIETLQSYVDGRASTGVPTPREAVDQAEKVLVGNLGMPLDTLEGMRREITGTTDLDKMKPATLKNYHAKLEETIAEVESAMA